eukprot:TRINITY_DN2878_c0_g1_i1.p1 TRINITY_DN2878_c0_g1~~TRINITY_DN2878_c0_g1_i1.p1  ORF type:complete len:349 (-),score=109.84 TRINITY_DN2878_c0_g1_i1:63-1016(-)
MEMLDFDTSPFLKGAEVSMIVSKAIAGRNEKEDILMLSDEAYYEIDGKSKKLIARIPLLGIHSVAVDPSHATVLTVTHLYGQKSKIARHARKIVGSGVSASEELHVRDFDLLEEEMAKKWRDVFAAALLNAWQSVLEQEVMPAPEVYQLHTSITKENRKGLKQVRVIAVSTQRIYNLKMASKGTVKSVKWSVPLPALDHITTSQESNAFTMHFHAGILSADEEKRKIKRSIKREYTFLAMSVKEKELLLDDLGMVLRSVLGRTLPIEGGKPQQRRTGNDESESTEEKEGRMEEGIHGDEESDASHLDIDLLDDAGRV